MMNSVVVLVLFQLVARCTSELEINGWYPCAIDTLYEEEPLDTDETSRLKYHRHNPFTSEPPQDFQKAWSQEGKWIYQDPHTGMEHYVQPECAKIQMPFIRNGTTSNRTLGVFVKRAKAIRPNTPTPQALWVFQGGPGASSIAMEYMMKMMYEALNGTVDMYTLDHRGVGRSRLLECAAAQVETPGSEELGGISYTELPSCMDDIRIQLDNHTEAFSVTNAAGDIKDLVEALNINMEVFVYGVSYGTFLVERLMQLDSKFIKGYILDGVVTHSGNSMATRSGFQNWDRDMSEVGQHYLNRCDADSACSSRFRDAAQYNLTKVVLDLYAELDLAQINGFDRSDIGECGKVLSQWGYPASMVLKITLGTLLQYQEYRTLIPVLVWRMKRCDTKDVQVLEYFIQTFYGATDPGLGLDYFSDMLYYLIVFSELWETPTPSTEVLHEWFESAVMGTYIVDFLPMYCLLTASQEDACLEFELNVTHAAFSYEKDHYWNQTSELPPNATALLFSGLLDPQTPPKYARYESALMKGDHRLIEFENAAHGVIYRTPIPGSNYTCAGLILASYINSHGDLALLNTDCITHVAPFNATVDESTSLDVLGTKDAYDGSIETKHMMTARAYYIAVAAMGTGLSIMTIIIILLCCRLYKLQRKGTTEMKSSAV